VGPGMWGVVEKVAVFSTQCSGSPQGCKEGEEQPYRPISTKFGNKRGPADENSNINE